MNRLVLIGCELIVEFDRALVVDWVGRAHLKENIALAAQRLAFFRRTGVTLQYFII